jgi:pimeloyl-ACP methyl ester carboxylesterase
MNSLLKCSLIILSFLVLLSIVILFWFPGLIFESAIHALRWKAGLKRKEVQVDDHHWVYLLGGKGETILFVHGFGSNKDGWLTFLSAFSKNYRVVVPDLPGFGESSKILSANYSVPSQVKRLNRFVDKIGLASFHLVGTSMGGYIAGYYAGEYPEKVKSLTLIDAAGVNSRIPSKLWQRFQESGENLLLYNTIEQFDELLSILFYHPPWVPYPLKKYFVKKRVNEYDFYEKVVKDILEGGLYLLEHCLPKIKAKTLLIWGANDQVTHLSSIEKFESYLKNSQKVIITECGHIPFFEKSKETKRAYRKFLAGLS